MILLHIECEDSTAHCAGTSEMPNRGAQPHDPACSRAVRCTSHCEYPEYYIYICCAYVLCVHEVYINGSLHYLYLDGSASSKFLKNSMRYMYIHTCILIDIWYSTYIYPVYVYLEIWTALMVIIRGTLYYYTTSLFSECLNNILLCIYMYAFLQIFTLNGKSSNVVPGSLMNIFKSLACHGEYSTQASVELRDKLCDVEAYSTY